MNISKEENELLKVLGIPLISNKRRYWLVRTQDGVYFDDFLLGNYIGIACYEILLKTFFVY